MSDQATQDANVIYDTRVRTMGASKVSPLVHYSGLAAQAERELRPVPRKPRDPRQVAAWLAEMPSHLVLPEAKVLANELALFAGYGHTVQPGCEHGLIQIGGIEVLAEYEFEPGDESPDTLKLIQVLFNGYWLDPAEFASASMIEAWEAELMAARIKRDEEALSDYQMDRGQARAEARS